MLFQTTSAHEELRAKIRSFAEEEIKPLAFLMDQNNEFPEEAVKKLGKLGWMGIPYPKEYGGAGLDALSYAIAVEELARVDGGTGVILSAHVSLGSWPIFAYGTEEQKKKYLVPLAKGEKIGAFGLTETNAGSDAGGTETTALDKGDYYLLNGGKIFITNAPKADTYVVFAVTTPDIGTRGISAFIVEKGWKGFEFGDHYDKMGIRSSSTAELIFNDVKVPKENLLGKEGEGFKIAMSTLDGGRIGIAAQALGIAQGAFEHALSYSKERVQFGKPIAAQQSIAFKLADMATKLRCARFLIYSAAELKEQHAPYGMESAMAKMYASDIALEVTNDALQIHGGSGFLKGMEVERAYRRQDHHHLRGHQRDPAGGHRLSSVGQAGQELRRREPFGGQETRAHHRHSQKDHLPRGGCCPAGGRPCGGAEEGWSRLLRGHPYGYAHPAGGAGGLRGQGHRGEKEHETGRVAGQGRRRGHRFFPPCGGDSQISAAEPLCGYVRSEVHRQSVHRLRHLRRIPAP